MSSLVSLCSLLKRNCDKKQNRTGIWQMSSIHLSKDWFPLISGTGATMRKSTKATKKDKWLLKWWAQSPVQSQTEREMQNHGNAPDIKHKCISPCVLNNKQNVINSNYWLMSWNTPQQLMSWFKSVPMMTLKVLGDWWLLLLRVHLLLCLSLFELAFFFA